MTALWTVAEVVQATGGRAEGVAEEVALNAVTIDSREVPEGALFVAIKGERLDGHDFAVPALAAGAAAALVSEDYFKAHGGTRLIVVADPLRYLKLSLSRIPVYFMFWPSHESGFVSNLARVVSFGVLWPFMLYGLVRSFIFRPWSFIRLLADNAFLLQLFALVYTAIHLLSWALIRYRLPVDAVLLVFAALAIMDLYQRICAARRLTFVRKPNRMVYR